MENIFASFKPFYYLSKLLGTFPATFIGPVKKGVLKTKWYDGIIPILSLSVLVFLFEKLIHGSYIKSDSTILMIAWNYSLVLELCFLAIQLFLQICSCKGIREFLKLIYEFDDKSKQIGIFVDMKKHKTAVYSGISLIALLGVVVFGLPILYFCFGTIENINPTVASAYMYTNLYKFYYAVQLALSCFTVRERFKALNDVLR